MGMWAVMIGLPAARNMHMKPASLANLPLQALLHCCAAILQRQRECLLHVLVLSVVHSLLFPSRANRRMLLLRRSGRGDVMAERVPL